MASIMRLGTWLACGLTMMLPPSLFSSSYSPAAAIWGVIVSCALLALALSRLCTALYPTRLPVRSTTRDATKTAWDLLGAPNERRIVTKLRAARMASGIPTSRPKRCGKPVSGMRLPKNRSDAHSSTVKSASACGLLTRLPSSSVITRSAPSKPSHATGCVTTVPTSKSSG